MRQRCRWVTVMATRRVHQFSEREALIRRWSLAKGAPWDRDLPRAPGCFVLARLATNARLGHPVLALVRGSAVNQDGASRAAGHAGPAATVTAAASAR